MLMAVLQESPVIVKIIEPPGDPTGIADVLLGALGLTGVLVIVGVLAALAFAGLLFWFRSRAPVEPRE